MTQPAMGLPGFPALAAVIVRMEAVLAQLREHRDPRRFFHATYLRTTRAVGAELAAGGFLDAAWVERWDVVFAGLYLNALESGLRGERVPGPWAAAFGAGGAVAPVRHVLLGMNAHINYALPLALLALTSVAELSDPARLAQPAADISIDQVLAALVDRADAAPGTTGGRSLPDRLLAPGKPPGHQAVPPPRPGPGLGQHPRSRPHAAGTAGPPTRPGAPNSSSLPPSGSPISPGRARCCCGSPPAASGSRSHPARIRRHGSHNTGLIMKETGR
jgi:hypothetical protein